MVEKIFINEMWLESFYRIYFNLGGFGDYMRATCKSKLSDVGKILNEIKRVSKDIGAVVIFVGVVRSNGGNVLRLEYEVHPDLADRVLAKIGEEIKEKYGLMDVIIEHKAGKAEVGEDVMIVAIAAKHRAEAFEAIKEIVDRIKKEAPIWKKEITKTKAYWKVE